MKAINLISDWVGRTVAWLTLAMVIVTFAVVVMRYLFDVGWIWLQESVTWMHAAVFMLGASYTLRADEHVRVDVFYRRMSAKRQAWVGVFGGLCFLLPMCGYLFWTSVEYVQVSWAINEASREAGGLPYPFVPLMKTLIPLTCVLLMAQGIADLAANIKQIRENRSQLQNEAEGEP